MNLPTQKQYVVPPLVVACVLIFIYFLPQSIRFELAFMREEILAGEWWRIITGQFVHARFPHLLLNLAGVFVIWLLFAERATPRQYAAAVLFIACSCMLGTLIASPQIEQYVGFSGALYGLFSWGAVRDIRAGHKLSWLLLALVCGKVAYDYFVGPVSLGDVETEVLATPTHLFGVFSGLLLAVVQRLPRVH